MQGRVQVIPLRITQITERYPPAIGGVETHVSRLSRELVKLGAEVTVLTTDLLTTKPMRRVAVPRSPTNEDGIVVYRLRALEALPMRQGLGIISPEVAFHLKGSDVIHAHGYGRFPTFVAPLRRILHTPVILTTHSDLGRPSLRKSFFDAAVSRLTVKSADVVIAVSYHEKKVLERLGVEETAIRVIPNGVDLGYLPRRRGRTGGRRTILYVGRLDFEQKGVDVLLRAVSKLVRERGFDVNLKLVGPDWGDLGRAVSIAKELQIQDSVEYLGVLPTEAIVDEMSSADVLALPSRFEPFGIAILEAMAAGLPVVASAVGGVPEVIVDGENGLLSEPGDATSLSGQISRILLDPEYGEKLAGSARRSVREYSWPNVASRVLSVYSEAAVRKAGVRS